METLSPALPAAVRAALLAALLAAPFAAPTPAAAQEPDPGAQAVAADTLYRAVLNDGSSFYGRIVETTATEIVLRTEGGARVEIERAQLRSLEPVRGRIVEGEVWPEDRNVTRLFFGPTGRALPRGEGYVGVFELFFSFAAVGATDRIVLAGGTPAVPRIIGRVFYLAPKATLVSADGWNLAAGALAFFATDALDAGSLGIVYGVGTYGDPDAALTLGAGWGFALGDDAALTDDPVLMIGAERRVSQRAKLITENYLIPDAGTLLSGGIRLMGERLSADLGLGAALAVEDFSCCLPVVSVVYAF